MKKRVFLGFLVALVIIGLVVGVVLAYDWPFLNTYNVKSSSRVSIWAESTCTTQVTSLSWGDLERDGAAAVRRVWVRNDGDSAVTLAVTFNGALTGITPNYQWPTGFTSLAQGEVVELILMLQAGKTAPLSPGTFITHVNSTLVP